MTMVSRTRRLPSLIVGSFHLRSTARQQPQRARRGEVDAQSRLAISQPDRGDLGGLVEGTLRAHQGERRTQSGCCVPARRPVNRTAPSNGLR